MTFIYPGDKTHIEQRKAEVQQIRREKIRKMPVERFKQMLLSKIRKNREK